MFKMILEVCNKIWNDRVGLNVKKISYGNVKVKTM